MESLKYVRENHKKVSHARACRMVAISRTRKYYQKQMPDKDLKLKQIISDAIGCKRIGRQKTILAVQKKHPEIGASKIRRVYQKEGFSLYKRLSRKRLNNPANPIQVPLQKNQEWALDFMSDSITSGRRFRTLNVIDQYNRQCLGIVVRFSITARVLIAYLEHLIEMYGKPDKIRTDNGPELTSKAFQLWLKLRGIQWSPIQKGKPQQNAIIERFNRTYREDVLDGYLFLDLEEAQQITDQWIENYNEERPHQSLNYLTPVEYAA